MSPHLAQVMSGGEARVGSVVEGEGEMLRRMLHKCSYVHAHQKSTAFCMLVLSKLKNTEQLYVEMLLLNLIQIRQEVLKIGWLFIYTLK